MFELLEGGKLASLLQSKALLYGVSALAVGIFLYSKGRSDCAVKHARQAAKVERQWAEKVRVSEAAAYERGLLAANLERETQEQVDEAVQDAVARLSASDRCVPGDLVERLRNL